MNHDEKTAEQLMFEPTPEGSVHEAIQRAFLLGLERGRSSEPNGDPQVKR